MAKEYTELQLKAKEAGVKSWHTKSDEKIEIELSKIEAPSQPVIESTPDEVAEPVDPMKMVRVLNGRTWDQAMMGIKGLGNKSDLWEYAEIIKEEYAKEIKEKNDKLIAQAKNNGK
jgi:hypothetical protein